MKFSLVLATIGRTAEVVRFLQSLERQTVQNVQLIVVDQNVDDRVTRILAAQQWSFEVTHLQSLPGLSHARNVGLRHVRGDVVAFPDDDCWYGPDLLERVSNILTADAAVEGITGRSIDEDRQESGGRFSNIGGILDMYTVWSGAISYTVFLRSEVCAGLTGGFDESLGVGAKSAYGSGEETDYLIRAMTTGARIRYDPELTVFHPNKLALLDHKMVSRALSYGMGMGRVLAKHEYPWHYRLKVLARPLIGACIAALTLRPWLCRYRWATMSGRLRGMRSKREILSDGR